MKDKKPRFAIKRLQAGSYSVPSLGWKLFKIQPHWIVEKPDGSQVVFGKRPDAVAYCRRHHVRLNKGW